MKIGFLTECMKDTPLEEIILWAGEAGLERIEIAIEHLGEDNPSRDEEVKKVLAAACIKASSVAHYDGYLLDDPANSIDALKASVDRCVRLGTDVLCTLTGCPPDGMTREEASAGRSVRLTAEGAVVTFATSPMRRRIQSGLTISSVATPSK